MQRSLYNLNDDEGDDLTHGGVPLKDIRNLRGPLDSDGELDEDGMLDGKLIEGDGIVFSCKTSHECAFYLLVVYAS